MAVPPLIGSAGGTTPPYVAGEHPPRRGDLIVMGWPLDIDPPPGWTLAPNAGGCWRYSDGTETSFPFPAAWFSGWRVATDEGTGAQ